MTYYICIYMRMYKNAPSGFYSCQSQIESIVQSLRSRLTNKMMQECHTPDPGSIDVF